MKTMPFYRYRPFPPVHLPDRMWPSRVIDVAPTWCSVDLRDGNQALIEPMDTGKKLRMFNLLICMGFKQIEVGFPSAAQVEFDFIRMLIEGNLIPDDVVIQVLTPARDEKIRRTFDAVHGAKRVIVHLYNSTSTLQRRVVFGLDRQGIIDLVVPCAQQIKNLADERPETEWTFQYSPESFTGTELDFSCRICSEVIAVWKPSKEKKVIINLPATVEMSTPNVYADMIEWMCRNLPARESLIVSLHPHNDRGTGIAATELGVMAGADRVEGTLFGGGERTGNVDIVTVALNFMALGIDPKLDISDITEAVHIVEECTGIGIHPRHPYAGDLVYTAFSGSHQDAIRKGRESLSELGGNVWEVPYLLIDPEDIGRSYQGLIRINSQSGKGGIAYVMEYEHHLILPRGLQIHFSAVVQKEAERTGKEVESGDVWKLFQATYLHPQSPITLLEYTDVVHEPSRRRMSVALLYGGVAREIVGIGNGPLDAFVDAIGTLSPVRFSLVSYDEHAISSGSSARAVAYVAIHVSGHELAWGVGIDTDITRASLLAVVSAVNRSSMFPND